MRECWRCTGWVFSNHNIVKAIDFGLVDWLASPENQKKNRQKSKHYGKQTVEYRFLPFIFLNLCCQLVCRHFLFSCARFPTV
ncbi:hypothetical protein EHQ16_15810 [Leptospira kanakyensis]|uniref:Uncharacterized protein n=1 Tax=Leptospira kanakyensis TaxID=2484968 RepID=A0A6N4QIC2_9LEPT|nr:hypothetical protein EHQ11_04120 [Leptospira kanakyensis]TGK57926.1 hypothetical protein EHQ16_15810 [Leptospira kanakyensis]TGK73623.1 hypothetical protein EHQ18_04195 [Leptospira kanakyensis]